MKTTIKAKVIIETDKYFGVYGPYEYRNEAVEVINLEAIRKEITNGNYKIEWINSELASEQEPTIIIKI